MKLPEKFEQRMQALLGKTEYKQFLAAYNDARTKGIRTNTLKVTSTAMTERVPFETTKVSWCQTGYAISPDTRPGKNPAYYAGLYYVQEPTAMIPAEVLKPEPGDWVLDLCAAPGGKTTQLACFLQAKGVLVANELVKNRAKILAQNVERMGITNTVITNEFPEHLLENFSNRFDKILVDAPCSGEGMFRKDEGAIQAWSVENVKRCAERQKKILKTVDHLLKPGGVLVYSTCTFAPEEDEQIVEYLIETGQYRLEPIELSGINDHGRPEFTSSQNPEIKKALRVMPHHVQGEGHFIARLRKIDSERPSVEKIKANKKKTKNQKKKAFEDYYAFAEKYLNRTFEDLYQTGDYLYSLPKGISAEDFKHLKVIVPGLHLGVFKKNRFEPAHTLAMALQKEDFKNVYAVKNDDEAYAYLKGEPLLVGGFKGWVLVMIDQHPIGFGKADGRVIKNHYPKGLRIMKK